MEEEEEVHFAIYPGGSRVNCEANCDVGRTRRRLSPKSCRARASLGLEAGRELCSPRSRSAPLFDRICRCPSRLLERMSSGEKMRGELSPLSEARSRGRLEFREFRRLPHHSQTARPRAPGHASSTNLLICIKFRALNSRRDKRSLGRTSAQPGSVVLVRSALIN